jgi:pimeloyl-ACP methyl ester carboxylesterase
VLFFDYRGSWGSPGDFSFAHAIEDTEAAIAYLRVPANATRLRADPQNLIVIGHSMGGMITAVVTARDPAIRAAIMISAANMAGRIPANLLAAQLPAAIKAVATGLAAQGMAPLAGCTPESLARELVDNAASWNFLNLAPKLASRPMLVISSEDGNTPSAEALVAKLKTAGAPDVSSIHIATDHSYSDHRIALQAAILTALDHLPTK